MSTLYFHTKDSDLDDVEMSGSERAHMSLLQTDIVKGLASRLTKEKVTPYVCGESLEKNPFYGMEDSFGESLLLKMAHYSGDFNFQFGEDKVSAFVLYINTAYYLGTDEIKLMSRIHNQCEFHSYILPKSFKWMHKIISRGLKNGIMRKNHGWEELLILLEKSKSPIVTSFSVDNIFPNKELLGLEEHEYDRLSYQDKFDKCFAKVLERESENLVEIKEEGFYDFYYGSSYSMIDIV